jgi:hypothetical protein
MSLGVLTTCTVSWAAHEKRNTNTNIRAAAAADAVIFQTVEPSDEHVAVRLSGVSDAARTLLDKGYNRS